MNFEMLGDLCRLYQTVSDKTVKLHVGRAIRILANRLTMLPQPTDRLTFQEKRMYENEGKITAIKAVRARTNLGLLESKQLVEQEAEKFGLTQYHTP
jgi:ribosomal protein L7/L12